MIIMDELDKALETLYSICEEHQCGDECPLHKLCQYLWNNNCYDNMISAIDDVFRLHEW